MPINEGITQKAIIDILLQKGSMEEPTLRRDVKKSLNLKDDSSIRVHISKLNESKCITKGSTQPGKANTWEISYDNLKHIVNKFPDMDFKENTNVIDLVFNHIKKSHWGGEPTEEDIKRGDVVYSGIIENSCMTLKYALINSDSFFKACITTDYETLYNRWNELLRVKYLTDKQYKQIKDAVGDSLNISPLGTAINHYIEQDIMNGKATEKEINYMILRSCVTMPDNAESIFDEIKKCY